MKIFAALLLAFFANASNAAGSVASIKISYLYAMSDGDTFVKYTSGAATGSPACNTSDRFAVSNATYAGRAIIEALSAAYMSGYATDVRGTGTCTVDPTSEDIDWVTIFRQTFQ